MKILKHLEQLDKNTNMKDFKKLMESDARRRAKKKENRKNNKTK